MTPMADYRKKFDRDYIYSYDLDGKDVTVTIREVKAGELVGQGGRKAKKPVLYFEESRDNKGLALCKTNAKIIAALYGNDDDKWVGKRITLFPTTTTFGSEVVECIRIRPTVPEAKGKEAA